ncbi:MAG: UvrD-helicase domain-containing protein [Candidatus Binatia bacterium]
MTERPLTPEQQRAVEVEGAAAVRAGAGTGKTTVLAHRFVHLLRPGAGAPALGVRDVLAITFTEKAAAEMRRRIRELVAERARAADTAVRRHWEGVRRDLLAAQISTIHAFCARILRENPLESGLDPRATILDEHAGRAWLDATIEAELVARLRAGDATVHALLLHRRGLRGAVAVCARLLGELAVAGRDRAWLADATARQEAECPAARATLATGARSLQERIGRRLATGKRTRAVEEVEPQWPGLAGFLARLAAGELPSDPQPLFGVARAVGALRLGVGDDLRVEKGRAAGALAEAYGFLVAQPFSRALATLLAELMERLRERKRAEGVLGFDDLVAEADALLARDPAVLARYGARFRALLVDEFQDTDAVQARLVERLAGAAPGTSLFVVGDEKQSIYRFRGAEVRVFQAMQGALGCELTLGTNFRSRPPILAFVNALAARTMRVPADGDAGHWTVFDDRHRLVAERASGGERPAVRFVTLLGARRGRDLDAAGVRELEARVLAGVVADLHDREADTVAYRDIAVLFRSLAQVKAYEHALRRREIPYYVVKGRGFFQCQEVRDVVSLLGAVADPDDAIALAATLRSPFFALADDVLWRLAWPAGARRPRLVRRFAAGSEFADLPEHAAELARARDLLARLRRLASRATIAELVEESLAATDLEAVLLTQFQGPQKVANVRKLIELARASERRGLLGLRDFVRMVRELTEEEPREAEAPLVHEQDDVVRLMTIHQAKGLEFPVVIIADLGRSVEHDKDAIVVDDDLGVIAAPVDGPGAHALRHAGLRAHRQRELDRERAERARLLYVACTRARDELVLLEGSADERRLRSGVADADRWCHQMWDVFGREAVAAFVDGTADMACLAVDGVDVRLERGERWVAASAPLAEAVPREAPAGPEEEEACARVLGFAPPLPAEVVTTPTALADFRRCPRQYWYRHVLGLPGRGGGGVHGRLRGTAAHGVLESIDLAAASDADVAAAVAQRPEALVLRRQECFELARDVTAAVTALRRELADGLELVGREVPFVLALPHPAPRLVLQGRIDLLARRGAVPVVRDYKYTRPSAAGAAEHGAQLAAYRLAAGADGHPAAADLVFLRGGVHVWALPPLDVAREEAAMVEAGVALGEALAVQDPRAFPRRPADAATCGALGCGYVARCWRVTGRAARRVSDSAGA